MSAPDSGDAAKPRRARILLVEDNDASSRGLAKLLGAMGFEVAVEFDGASALRALREGPAPDFLLTDLRLPDLDGREIALAARQLNPRPRIALITGWDLEYERSTSASWGIDWVFTKPVDVRELVEKLRGGDEAPGGEHAGESR